MKTRYKIILIMLVPVIFVTLDLQAQSYHLVPGVEFTVSGTSSLHDWTMTSRSATGEAVFDMTDKMLKGVSELSVTLQAKTLKSGKSGMDDNAYKALETKKNPEITFNITNAKAVVNKGEYYEIDAEGALTVAGETRIINLKANAYPDVNGIKITGNKTFKMTDFKIDPPTALFGTVKTGDQITINYNLTFKIK